MRKFAADPAVGAPRRRSGRPGTPDFARRSVGSAGNDRPVFTRRSGDKRDLILKTLDYYPGESRALCARALADHPRSGVSSSALRQGVGTLISRVVTGCYSYWHRRGGCGGDDGPSVGRFLASHYGGSIRGGTASLSSDREAQGGASAGSIRSATCFGRGWRMLCELARESLALASSCSRSACRSPGLAGVSHALRAPHCGQSVSRHVGHLYSEGVHEVFRDAPRRVM